MKLFGPRILKHNMALFYLAVIVMLFLSACSTNKSVKKAPDFRVVETTLAKGIEDIDHSDVLLTPTTTFTTRDNAVIAHIRLANLVGNHKVRWQWYRPDHTLYYESDYYKIVTTKGKYAEEVTLWHKISIENDSAQHYPGKWTVQILLDGNVIAAEYFDLKRDKRDMIYNVDVNIPSTAMQNPDGIDFKGKAITVRSENGPQNCIISGGGDGRSFYFHTGELNNSVVSGFTITGGVIDGWSTGGGGILCEGASPTISNCIIRNNRTEAIAWGGGGISCTTFAAPVITNCVIESNSAVDADGGGGIYCDNASPVIRNCTIVNNSAGTDSGGGIYIFGPSSTLISNTIFWGNSPNQIDYSNTAPDITYSDIEGGFPGTGNITSDPLFAGAGVYSLATGSPCIDAGTASGAPSSDIEGNTRPLGAGYDMGAYESQ